VKKGRDSTWSQRLGILRRVYHDFVICCNFPVLVFTELALCPVSMTALVHVVCAVCLVSTHCALSLD